MTTFKQFSKISINLWINLNSLSNYTIMESSNVVKISYIDDGNGLEFKIWDDTDTAYSVRSGSSLDTDDWYMVTLVYNQSNLKGYVNSNTPSEQSTSSNSLYNGNGGFTIGKFDGRAQEFRVYDYELSSSDIQGMYDVIDTPGSILLSKKTI